MAGQPEKRMAFTVDLGAYGKCAVVHVTGDLDWVTSPSLIVMVEHLWDFLNEGCLILNLTPMLFCDSTGVSALITVFRGCRERGIRLILAGTPRFLLRMLTTTGLIELFEVHDTLDQVLSNVDGWEPEPDTRIPPFAVEA
ncbi:STAS domain-containing protein [Streptosporangium sp. G12]